MTADFSVMIKNGHSRIVCCKSTFINIPDWCGILFLRWLKIVGEKDIVLRQAQDKLQAGSRFLIISKLKTSIFLTSCFFTIFAVQT
jgi:hypothetical protein